MRLQILGKQVGRWVWASVFIILLSRVFCGCKNKIIERDLIAFTDGQKTVGTFYLLGGNIDWEPIYKYLWKQSDDGIRMGWVDARMVTIYETDDIAPKMKMVIDEWSGRDTWNYVWIPRHSIRAQFNVDLE